MKSIMFLSNDISLEEADISKENISELITNGFYITAKTLIKVLTLVSPKLILYSSSTIWDLREIEVLAMSVSELKTDKKDIKILDLVKAIRSREVFVIFLL